MPQVRLFAQARDAAGTSSTTAEGGTVSEVLQSLVAMFGSSMAEVLEVSRVWVNGEPASPQDAVGDADEVAVLPPVSGGCL